MTPRRKIDSSIFFDGCWMFLAVVFLAALIMGAFSLAYAQHVQNHSESDLHIRFYSTWMRPNGVNTRKASCCNMIDCYATVIRHNGGKWEGLRREDKKWIFIPNDILEENLNDSMARESPDHQSHMCAPRPNPFGGDIVYCAVRGSAI
jgi:hypothetical protein